VSLSRKAAAAEMRHPRWIFVPDPDGWFALHKNGLARVYAPTLEDAEQRVRHRDSVWAGIAEAVERIQSGYGRLPSPPTQTAGLRERGQGQEVIGNATCLIREIENSKSGRR
jgi:hypothetical protein